jgi:DNA-binding GntR family transcriptional regulator
MDRVRYLSLIRFPMGKLLKQHEAIAARIAEGDAAGAEEAIRGHLREILNDLPAIAADKPDLFETRGA